MIHEIQWTNETLFNIKYISHFILERSPQFVVNWKIDGETYTQREVFFPYLLSKARWWFQRLHPLANRVVREVKDASARLCVPRLTLDILPLSKSDRMVITWSPSGYTPVGLEYPDALSSPCLLITTWQLVKAQEVTRNEPKIHVICYITHWPPSRVEPKKTSALSARFSWLTASSPGWNCVPILYFQRLCVFIPVLNLHDLFSLSPCLHKSILLTKSLTDGLLKVNV